MLTIEDVRTRLNAMFFKEDQITERQMLSTLKRLAQSATSVESFKLKVDQTEFSTIDEDWICSVIMNRILN
jgi:hypothetical protein